MAPDGQLRILSLIASATEIVCALGFRDRLVGRSHECDFPPDIRALPKATNPRFNVDASSRAIDEQVRELVRKSAALNALGVYEVLPGVLQELRPTHIVTQTQCEVCAVSGRDVEEAVAEAAGCDAQIVSLEPNALADVWKDFSRVAAALGAASEGDRLVASLRRRMQSVSEVARGLPSQPRVAAIEWVEPLMAVGNWMPELISMAGGRCLFGQAGMHSPAMRFDELRDADPDVIVLSPCGYGIDRTLGDLPILEEQPGWKALQAVRSGRVYVGDGNQYFNRPGPRLAETLEILAEMLHPNRFRFGHKGTGWVTPYVDNGTDSVRAGSPRLARGA